MRTAGMAIVATCSLVLASCGAEEERFSEKKVFEATKVEGGEVEGDPFCVVDSVLSNADAIAKERKKDPAGIITSKNGNVGVVVEPPFPDDCEKTVLDGLNKLDPVKEKEKE